MSHDQLSNPAVAIAQRSLKLWNDNTHAPTNTSGGVTDDFTLEDRRSGGVNFGTIDASAWDDFLSSTWDVGAGQPRYSMPEIVAVRGQRCAAIVMLIEFDDDSQLGFLNCLRVDRALRRGERMVTFDLDDRAAAIAELDRMHAEIDD